MGKIAEIRNDNQSRTFDLIREEDALYFSVKCSDNKGHSKFLRIKVSDVIYQLWNHMTYKEKQDAYKIIRSLISSEGEIA